MNALSLCILGCGNIGSAIAKGLEKSDQFVVGNITLTRRKVQRLEKFKKNHRNFLVAFFGSARPEATQCALMEQNF